MKSSEPEGSVRSLGTNDPVTGLLAEMQGRIRANSTRARFQNSYKQHIAALFHARCSRLCMFAQCDEDYQMMRVLGRRGALIRQGVKASSKKLCQVAQGGRILVRAGGSRRREVLSPCADYVSMKSQRRDIILVEDLEWNARNANAKQYFETGE